MQVLPPANGKKMWRVKRTPSTNSKEGQQSDSSRECLNSSLKISAAGKTFMMRRPPMKRPRAKFGESRAFVFVDLSPVKSEEDSKSITSVTSDASFEAAISPRQETAPIFCDEFSFMSTSSVSDENLEQSLARYDLQAAMLDEDTLFGLGLMDIDYDFQQPVTNDYRALHNMYGLPEAFDFLFPQFPQFPRYSQFPQIPQQDQTTPIEQYATCNFVSPAPQPEAHITTAPKHRRTQSASAVLGCKSAGGLQFKTYKGPKNVKKTIPRRVRRTLSQPTLEIKKSMDAMLPPQFKEPITPTLQCTATSENAVSQNPDYFLDLSTDDISSGCELLDIVYTPLTDYSEAETFSTLLEPINFDVFPVSNYAAKSEDVSHFDGVDFTSYIAT